MGLWNLRQLWRNEMKMDKVILGENVVYSTDCKETGLNNNVLVCGSSGCGKTMSVLEPCLMETFQSSLIVTVTKRRIVDKYKFMFKKRGYIVEDLNFINPNQSDVAYDPLQYIGSYADIRFLAESIVKANPQKDKSVADPYWDQAAISLLCAEISYTMMRNDKATFADVLELHDSIRFEENNGMLDTSLDYKFKYIEKQDPNCFAVSCWNSFCRLPIRTASCVFGTLNTTIDTIFSPELRRMIKMEKKVDFERIATQKTVLFVSTSAVNPALHCFINMFYAQVFKQLFEFAETQPLGKLPVPVRVFCDDFATGGKVLNFDEYISIFREKQISVTLLLQSESQLESMYSANEATTIINNCDTYLYMGGMDLKTARHISERLNAPLEEILSLPIDQTIIFRRGQKPIVTRRYNVYQNKVYQEVTRQYEKRVMKGQLQR